MIDERFMEIRQALGTMRSQAPGTVRFLASAIEELKPAVSSATRSSARARMTPS